MAPEGTGRARQGSIRAPQWTHGGIVFAPKPRDYSYTLNKKVKRLALKSVLSAKAQEENVVVIDEIKLDAIKTKPMAAFLKLSAPTPRLWSSPLKQRSRCQERGQHPGCSGDLRQPDQRLRHSERKEARR